MPDWIFPIKDSKHKARNPISDEFFDSPELLTDVSSLVRESIQNSIDAKTNPAAPVEVRITLGEIAGSGLAPYFGNLQPHLSAAFGDQTPSLTSNCRYLVVEDFNTTGLTGDSTLDTAPEGKESVSAYTYFVHVEGESNKGAGKKGKWGVGKVVFQMLSQIKTFYIYTNRADDFAPDGENTLFIGQSIIKYHKIDGKTYAADGWFAQDNEEGPYLPFTGQSAKELASGWGVSRNDETGLSIVIPFISENVQMDAIRDAIIREYFIPIIKGDLVCTLVQEGEETINLDKANLLTYLSGITLTKNVVNDRSADEVRAAIELVEAAESNSVEEFSIAIPDNLISISNLSLEEDLVTSIREAFESGQKVKVKVSVTTPTSKPDNLVRDSFEVLFMKSEVSKSATFYAREGILVPGRPIFIPGCMSLTLVESGALADLLGAAEGPAHADWSKDTQKFKRTYGNAVKAAKLVPIVRGVADKIVQLISSQSGSFDNRILSQFFKMPEKPGGDDGKVIDPPPPPPPKIQLPANVSPVHGGFKVSAPDKDKRNGLLTIKVAYEVNRGNAFKKYNPLDFTFDNATFDLVNCTIVRQSANEIVIEVGESAFSISNSQLGTLRDIEVDLSFQATAKQANNA